MRRGIAALLLCLSCALLYPQAETFGSIYNGLDRLESLMQDMLKRNEILQDNTRNLETNLAENALLLEEREVSIEKLEGLSADLKRDSERIQEAYKKQLELLAECAKRSKNLKLCIAIGLPAAAVISGLAGFALGRR